MSSREPAYQEAKKFYNGYTQEDFVTSDALGINGMSYSGFATLVVKK